MSEPPVVNASPLIYLSRAGLTELLRVAGSIVVVPSAVSQEIRKRGTVDPTVAALNDYAWLREADVVHESPAIQSWHLGQGETAVLTWAAHHQGCRAIIDDRQGRRCAAFMGIPCIGTLGIVLLAKRKRLIHAARPVLDHWSRLACTCRNEFGMRR